MAKCPECGKPAKVDRDDWNRYVGCTECGWLAYLGRDPEKTSAWWGEFLQREKELMAALPDYPE